MNMWYSEVQDAFFDIMVKMKIVGNSILKVLICVRTDFEELLNPQIRKWCILNAEMHVLSTQ